MADDIATPRPALVTVPNVELAKTGGPWETTTGKWDPTPDDFAAAVAALSDPAVRAAVVKLGHTDSRFDGQPTIGRVCNLRTTDNGCTLVGDLVGVPAWIAEILPTAWPSRSVEGEYGYITASGAKHRFVLTGLALLGIAFPAVETLDDVAALYGVAAADSGAGHGQPVHATFGGPMPNPTKVAASVTADDIREAYYDGPGAGPMWWIRELMVDPMQLIVCNDDDMYRVPFTIDGVTVTFGDPVEVRIEYLDADETNDPDYATDGGAVAAASWRTRAESRPPKVGRPPRVAAAGPQGQEGDPPVDLSQLREALGLPDDATDEQVLEAALDKATAPVVTPPEPAKADPVTPPTPTLPEGVVTIDESTLGELVAAAKSGVEARDILRRQDRDRFLDEAVRAGKFAPARKQHFEALYDADETGTRQVIAGLAAGTIPLVEAGHSGGGVEDEFEAFYATHYGKEA